MRRGCHPRFRLSPRRPRPRLFPVTLAPYLPSVILGLVPRICRACPASGVRVARPADPRLKGEDDGGEVGEDDGGEVGEDDGGEVGEDDVGRGGARMTQERPADDAGEARRMTRERPADDAGEGRRVTRERAGG